MVVKNSVSAFLEGVLCKGCLTGCMFSCSGMCVKYVCSLHFCHDTLTGVKLLATSLPRWVQAGPLHPWEQGSAALSQAGAGGRSSTLGWARCGARANSSLTEGFLETTHMLLPLTSTLLGPDRLGFCWFIPSLLSTALFPGLKVVSKCVLCDNTVISVLIVLCHLICSFTFFPPKMLEVEIWSKSYPASLCTCDELTVFILLLMDLHNCTLFVQMFKKHSVLFKILKAQQQFGGKS